MAAIRQTAEQTLADVIKWRPALANILQTFEPILTAQSALCDELTGKMKDYGLTLPQPQFERIRQGASVLAGESLKGLAGVLKLSAEKILPLLDGIEALGEHMPAVKAYFEQDINPDDSRDTLAEAMVAGDYDKVTEIAKANELEPQLLDFCSTLLLAPALHALVAESLPEEGEAPWDESNAWQEGYCPVCGAMPSISWLDKPTIDEKNAYLAGGGGKKHLHCGLCGANWQFKRATCPACKAEGNGVMEMFRESGVAHGERLDWCTKCNTYCPTIDLREREFVPHPEAAALGMMHLDMVAAGKKLQPLRPSFWNMF